MDNIEIINSNQLIDYKDSIKIMEKRVHDINLGIKNELIWFLNHDHVYTQGTSSLENEIIKEINTPIIKTNRGGKITYHGPGQRIVYFIINLKKRKKDIRSFISVIENSLILFLKKYNIESTTYKDRVGVWVTKSQNKKLYKEEKIGAIGLRLKKWISFHGLSVNINPNLSYYNNIHACGLKNYDNTSLNKLNIKINNDEFDESYKKIFLNELNKF